MNIKMFITRKFPWSYNGMKNRCQKKCRKYTVIFSFIRFYCSGMVNNSENNKARIINLKLAREEKEKRKREAEEESLLVVNL